MKNEEHHFGNSLKRELESGNQADVFYKRAPFSVTEIQRYNRSTEEDMILQRQDIDLSISFPDGRKNSVSEKFRAHDYNDLLLEIYSKYPETKGWIHKSHAERLAYFFPERMMWIDKKALSLFCIQDLFPLVEKDAIERLLSQEANSLKVGLRLKGQLYYCILTQAFNRTGNDVWNTISISVPFSMLNDFEIRFQEYKLD
jgi:hypothetical protein